MKPISVKICLALSLLFITESFFAQTKPLYQLPETLPEKKVTFKEKDKDGTPFLLGTDRGLYKILGNGTAEPLWTDGKVERIIKTSARWFFLTDKGIISSPDLNIFTERNNGLPFLTVKSYDGVQKQLEQKAALLKDICADPFNPDVLVTATKDAVYLTRDGAQTWENIGSASKYTAGVKAVAVSHMPVYDRDGTITGSELVVFMSHPIYGFSYYRADAKKPAWFDVSAGFAAMPSMTQVDEIADILPVMCKDANGSHFAEVYLSQTFLPNIYRFNWKDKRGEKVYQGEEQIDTIDGLCQTGSSIAYSALGKVSLFSLVDKKITDLESYDTWKSRLNAAHSIVNSAYIPKVVCGLDTPLELSELWLLNPDVILTPWGEVANKKKAVYSSVYQLRNDNGIEKYRKIVNDNKLNSIVIDMKDDYGLLRFEPESPLLKEKGKVTVYKIDVDKLVNEFKKDGTYLIGRIVVFKDRNLAGYDKGKYAVWNYKTNSPWVGIRSYENITAEDGTVTGQKANYYDENWVDPYSEEVWEYNVEIAKELIKRGFDEIQFDYIRFPTDGLNMGSASYRWKDKGMDKESALVSFLSYARKNIDAPIGIDIYGANGWYRSGTRTGQDVELMSEYVDVICPMFYPSHFEQSFLDYSPYEERPYRIFFYGSYRNTVIGRNRIVVRPWLQAFYMGVRYDRKYYDKNYVSREVFGVRDGINRGYMYWNNSGGYYEDISPDPEDSTLSPWHHNEAAKQTRIPAFSKEMNPGESEEGLADDKLINKDEILSVWNTVLEQEDYENPGSTTRNFLMVEPFPAVNHE
ncbi:putative glycoside hydrolase [Treponema sp.]|uniref:putative glycoside hydrolase n=1 Tax=Treponema sp. TaxID=166 RepID=UPI00298EA9ED|nr:putative glycoside hydrolase [Treponema sp.]